MDAFLNLLHPDRMPRMTKRWAPQVPYRMDRYLTPAELKRSVLRSERMVALIEKHANHDERKRLQLAASVRDILDEIGLGCSMPIIRWSGICLNQILMRLCTEVNVNDRAMRRLKATIGDRPVLYLPSHRSYLDFVLMSYVCFAYDLTIPGIAAGMDFHGMAGVGRLIRQTCAFFMRRSFGEDPLYWQVFAEYMHQLVTVYHTGVEFFIEGTRSRSFKALPPKIGLLSMALQPLFAGEVPDITIVPIGVAYERPLEEQLFAYELLGVPKPRESTLALFKALKVLGTNHGSMYINFGEPISARDYFGAGLQRFEHAPLPVHVQHLSRTEMRMIGALGQHVVVQQQRLIVLTVFNLMAVCFNCCTFAKRSADVVALRAGVVQLAGMLRTLGALVALDDACVATAVADGLRMHADLLAVPEEPEAPVQLLRPELTTAAATATVSGTGGLKAHQLAAGTLRDAVPVLTMQIYANPCMFWLAGPAFVLLAVHALRSADVAVVQREAVAAKYAHIRRIYGEEFVLSDDDDDASRFTVPHMLHTLSAWGVLDAQTLRVCSGESSLRVQQLLLGALVPFLCCYLQVADTLATAFAAGEPFAEKLVLVRTQQRVEEAIAAGRPFVHSYCLSLDSIGHALHSFQANGYVERTRSANEKEVLYKCESPVRVLELHDELLHWCRLLPFGIRPIMAKL